MQHSQKQLRGHIYLTTPSLERFFRRCRKLSLDAHYSTKSQIFLVFGFWIVGRIWRAPYELVFVETYRLKDCKSGISLQVSTKRKVGILPLSYNFGTDSSIVDEKKASNDLLTNLESKPDLLAQAPSPAGNQPE